MIYEIIFDLISVEFCFGKLVKIVGGGNVVEFLSDCGKNGSVVCHFNWLINCVYCVVLLYIELIVD